MPFKKGFIPWNKGKHTGLIPWNKGKRTGLIPWNKGKKGVFSAETILRMSKANKGKIPWTAHPIGTEKVDKHGFIRIKISNHPNKYTRWRLKHHILYEKYHPNVKIGKTDRVIFLDGNRHNFDIHNLELVSLSEQIALSKLQKNYICEEKLELLELIKANLKIKKIEKLIQEKYSGN